MLDVSESSYKSVQNEPNSAFRMEVNKSYARGVKMEIFLQKFSHLCVVLIQWGEKVPHKCAIVHACLFG